MKLYDELASWWQLMSPATEYAEEAAAYHRTFRNAARHPIETMLELGSGGGNNASHLKKDYKEMVLVDLSPQMLAMSRALNPDLRHRQGDMRTIRLDRQFDAVFVHDAICYMTTETALRDVFETAFAHCKVGGVALFAPDYVRETFEPGTDHGGHDDGARGMRWVEWRYDPDHSDTTYVVDYAYLLRRRDGSVSVEQDRHIEGLFPRADWLRWLAETGFEVKAEPLGLIEPDTQTLEVFVCVKPEI